MPSTADLNLMVLCKGGRLKETIHNQFITHNLNLHSSLYFQLSHSCIAKNATSQCKQIHSLITDRGFAYAACIFFQNNLMNMYVKTGRVLDARQVFDEMTERDVSSWNTIIAAYRRHAYPREALALFHLMQRTDTQPDQFTFASILPACAKVRALEQGMSIHQSIVERRYLSDFVVVSALIDMYGKCGNVDKARKLFDKIPQRNVVSWNALIAGYAQNGIVERVLESFKHMQLAGVKPVSATFASILPACAKMGALEQGMEIHRCTTECGFLSDLVVANALLDMYAKCRSVHKACNLFDKMPHRDVVSWNAMIAGYAQNGFDGKALETFKEMNLAALNPDSTTFASILPACAKMGALKQGMHIHQNIIERELLSDVIVASALVDMYAKCGDVHKASELFTQMPQRNVVSWNAMIAGYAQNGFVEEALNAFNQMQLAGVKPVSRTFASILPACAKVGALGQGMDIHQGIIESGLLSDVVVTSSLVDMYAKCGNIYKARELFDKMCQRNVISWNAMIAGYAQNGFYKDALELFQLMKPSGTLPDHVSFACVLLACSHSGLVDEGCKYFNVMSDFYSILPAINHYACVVDLLGRAGYLEEALNFIIKMPIKPMVVVWTCLLGACRPHKNVELGFFTATLLSELDHKNAASHVILSNIYAEVGRWGEVQMLRRLMKDKGIKKITGCSWIEEHKMVHVFCAGDRSHPQTHDIYAKLNELSREMKLAGYFPDLRHVPNDVEEEEKQSFLYHHSEKLAIAFGLLNTVPGTTIRVVKNLRVCVDCHTATKFISKIIGRQIVVRDTNRFHYFNHGQCSCRDYW